MIVLKIIGVAVGCLGLVALMEGMVQAIGFAIKRLVGENEQ